LKERNITDLKKPVPINGGEWDDKREICKIEDDEEKAAYEDYVCDDIDDYNRYPKICQLWSFEE
jgi:hypothetical protein